MRLPILPFAVLALATAVAVPRDARATSLIEYTTEQMVDASDLVVHGTVVEVWTEPDERGRVWTRAQIDVLRVLKGDADLDSVVVDQIGGTWSGQATLVYSAARFDVGEELVVFLQRVGGDRLVPTGYYLSKYTVRLDPYARQEIVQRNSVPPTREYDHRFLPLPPAEKRVSLTDFEDRIAARVAEGWDGQPIPGISQGRLERINGAQGVK